MVSNYYSLKARNYSSDKNCVMNCRYNEGA